MLTTQLPVPVQAPLQPAKVLPVVGVAVSVTLVPLLNAALQVAPQSIPDGALVTVPEPAPLRVKPRVKVTGGVTANEALTLCAALMLTTQLPVPVQAPLQPAKVLPVVGVAVSVTLVPLLNAALQAVPQLMPAGVLVMVPEPVPVRVTLSVVVAIVTVTVALAGAPILPAFTPVTV